VTAKWQELGEALGMDEDLLDEIFTNNATDDECLRAALKQWLKIRPACEDLSDALQKIGESQLAELLHPTCKLCLSISPAGQMRNSSAEYLLIWFTILCMVSLFH